MSAVTYNAVVRDYNQAGLSRVIGRLLLPDLEQVPSSWTIEFRGKVLERTVDLNELMCSPQEPLQLRKPMIMKSDCIYLSTMSGKIIELPSVSLNDKVDTLKNRICLIEWMKKANQGLICGSQSLEEDNRTLKDYGVQYGSPIQLVLCLNQDNVPQSFQPSEGPFVIFVNTLTGKTLRVKVSSEDTVDILKSKIEDIEGILAVGQRLMFAGYQLMDDNILRNYGIGDGSTLLLVENLLARIRAGYFPGLNLLGVCSKVTCRSNLRQEPVIMNERYGVFKMTPGRDMFPCYACPCSSNYTGESGTFSPQNFVVSSARSLFRFKKTGYDQPVKAVLIESLGSSNEPKKFDASKGHADYDLLEITTVGVNASPYFCVICDTPCEYENVGSVKYEKILSCGHAYHWDCAPVLPWDKGCVVCLAELFENLTQLLEADEKKPGGHKRGPKMKTGMTKGLKLRT